MRDIWGFLIQTLTASGAAALLLAVKAMFRDKLSPRWHFAVWSVLGLVLLLPAGLFGRYALFNWPWLVELLKTVLTGEYGVTRVVAPIPLPRLALPETAGEWLFAVYAAGVVVLLIRYAIAYLRLRGALRIPAGTERAARIRDFAARNELPVCPIVEVPGLASAFICGVFRPVLALPKEIQIDGKVLLHELLHLKHRDAAWSLVICFFRCVHWCNPLLWYCADRASNDLEARCDQRVLERLEGEDLRHYGHILLSMANDKYARTPGATSMANGGHNIRRRIEAIAHFRKYPKGMGLVSVCVAVLLAAPLLLGTQARSLYFGNALPDFLRQPAAMASARTVRCTTPAGALDAYGKAVLERNPIYRAMCAPLADQRGLAKQIGQAERRYGDWIWDSGLGAWADPQAGYYIYNLEPVGEEVYEGLLAVKLVYPPEGLSAEEDRMHLGLQTLRAERQGDRWVVIPQEAFRTMETEEDPLLWGCEDLPSYLYEGEAADFRVLVRYQQVFTVDNTVTEETGMSWFTGPSTRYDTVPKPDAAFEEVHWSNSSYCVYTGSDKAAIERLGISLMPLWEGEDRPVLRNPGMRDGGGSSNTGEDWGSKTLDDDWGPLVRMSGGGSTRSPEEAFHLPESYAADLYINGKMAAELTLAPWEGGPS